MARRSSRAAALPRPTSIAAFCNYAHDGSETFADGFGFEVSDGLFTIDGQSFAITVGPVNDDPIGVDDSYGANFETPLSIPVGGVLANDTDAEARRPDRHCGQRRGLRRRHRDRPGLRSAPDARGNGSFDYTPAATFSGEDSFTYTVEDGDGGSDTATVTVDVAPSGTRFRALHQLGRHQPTPPRAGQPTSPTPTSRAARLQDDQPDRGDAGGHAVPD